MRFRLLISLCLLLFCRNLPAQSLTQLLQSATPDHLKADSINILAKRYMFKLRYDSAKICMDTALYIALRSRNDIIIARCYIDMASMSFMRTRFREGAEILQKAKPYYDRVDHYEVHLAGLMLWANLHNVLERKDSALHYYRLAEQYNLERNPYRNWLVYTAMAEMYNQTDNDEAAEKYFLRAYNMTVKKEGKPDHLYMLAIFLNYYLGANRPESAGPLIQEFDELQEERKRKNIDDPLREVMMGVTNNKLTSNTAFMQSVKEKAISKGMLHQAEIANNYLLNYYEKKREYEKALEYAADGVKLAEETGVIQHIYGSKRIQYNLFMKAGRYEEAGKLAERLIEIKDSMLAIQKREQVYELEARFDSERKQQEIELLQSRNKTREQEFALLLSEKKMASLLLLQEISRKAALARENALMDSIVKKEQAYSQALVADKGKQLALNEALSRENNLRQQQLQKERSTRRLLIAGTALLVLLVAAVLWLYSRQRRKSAIIAKQAGDLEILMKEIHHRVKNNLQIVGSLLDLQSHSITDAQALEAVKEGRNRVQSMALIHQNLYSEGNIKGIRLREYVSNLLQTLCDSYNITNDKVRIQADIDDLNLDVDTMIPLGLVLNELVSNAFKYAFPEQREGELAISLKQMENSLHLRVQDNGNGFPATMDIQNSRSFGMKMIRAFAKKLKGGLHIFNEKGAVVEMTITKFKLA